jgi:hypothetical protein
MSMSNTIRGGIAVLMGLLSLYILENTYGTAMDQLYLSFTHLLTIVKMGPGWSGVATTVLGGWVWFYRAFVICVIALFVWFASLIFVEQDLAKRY